MSDDNLIEIRMDNLNKLLKGLKTNRRVRIGILGNTQRSGDGESTNAEIGLKHEFGQDGMPVRSFLRMPLIDNLQAAFQKSGVFSDEVFKKVFKTGKIDEFMKKLGIIAEGVVLDAFNTGGFGKWKRSVMRFKKNHQTLVETQQLRNSITSELE